MKKSSAIMCKAAGVRTMLLIVTVAGPICAQVSKKNQLTPPVFLTLKGYDPAKAFKVDYNRVGENRFRNASFELANRRGNASDWMTVGPCRVTAENRRSGQSALRLEKPAKGDGRLVQDVPHIQGGASYRAVIYLRSAVGAQNVNIKFEVYAAGDKYLGGFRSEHFIISNKQTWTRVEYAHKLPPLPDLRVRVLFRLWNAGAILLDDASFSLVRQTPLYLSPEANGERLVQTPNLVAWTAPLPTRIRADHPVDAARTRAWAEGRLHLRLAGNETGILPLFISTVDSDLSNINVQVEPAPANGQEEWALYTVEPFAYLGDLYYDVLVPMNSFTLPAGHSKMVWLSVAMHPGTQRAATKGALLVSARGMAPVRIPFTIETFAFDLPCRPSLPFSVGIPRPGRRIRPAERRRWMRDIARHRLSIRFLASPVLRFEGDLPVFDFADFDAELARATDFGMGLFQLPYASDILISRTSEERRLGALSLA